MEFNLSLGVTVLTTVIFFPIYSILRFICGWKHLSLTIIISMSLIILVFIFLFTEWLKNSPHYLNPILVHGLYIFIAGFAISTILLSTLLKNTYSKSSKGIIAFLIREFLFYSVFIAILIVAVFKPNDKYSPVLVYKKNNKLIACSVRYTNLRPNAWYRHYDMSDHFMIVNSIDKMNFEEHLYFPWFHYLHNNNYISYESYLLLCITNCYYNLK